MLHLAVGSENAAIGRHLFGDAHAHAQVRDLGRRRETIFNRFRGIADRLPGVCHIEHDAQRPRDSSSGLGLEVAQRRIVLMQRVYRDAARRRPHRFRDSFAPLIVALIADSDRIDGKAPPTKAIHK